MMNFFQEIESSYIYMRQGGGLGEPQGNKTLQCQFLSHQETFSPTLNVSWYPTEFFLFLRKKTHSVGILSWCDRMPVSFASRNIQLDMALASRLWFRKTGESWFHVRCFYWCCPIAILSYCCDTVMLLSALVRVLWNNYKKKQVFRGSE